MEEPSLLSLDYNGEMSQEQIYDAWHCGHDALNVGLRPIPVEILEESSKKRPKVSNKRPRGEDLDELVAISAALSEAANVRKNKDKISYAAKMLFNGFVKMLYKFSILHSDKYVTIFKHSQLPIYIVCPRGVKDTVVQRTVAESKATKYLSRLLFPHLKISGKKINVVDTKDYLKKHLVIPLANPKLRVIVAAHSTACGVGLDLYRLFKLEANRLEVSSGPLECYLFHPLSNLAGTRAGIRRKGEEKQMDNQIQLFMCTPYDNSVEVFPQGDSRWYYPVSGSTNWHSIRQFTT